jgi:SnoaL-like domain
VRAAAIVLLTACVAAGCGGGGSKLGPAPSDARVIRAWVEAVDRADYDTAASFFAPNAVVQQVDTFRLPDHKAAVDFNSSLPCRARLTAVRDEGRTTIGTFRLRDGPGGPGSNCNSSVRVRFRLRKGRFTEWRQLPERAPPPGSTA